MTNRHAIRFTKHTIDSKDRATLQTFDGMHEVLSRYGIEPMYPSATLRACYIEDAHAILNKLADRAASYGQTITWTELHYVTHVLRRRWDGKPIAVAENWAEIYVKGGAPKVGDHKFVAMLERMKGGTIAKAVPGEEVGDYGRDWDGRCDHCGSKRDRVHGYVIEDQNGRSIVGKSCVRDYLGMDDPANLLLALRDMASLKNFGDDDEDRFGYAVWSTEVWGIVAAARAAVALFGYAPKSMGDRSTIALVNAILGSGPKDTREQKALIEEMRTRGDHYAAESMKVIEWAREMTPTSDYLHNVKVILGSDYVKKDHVGIAVSSVAAYDNEMARLQRIRDAMEKRGLSTGYVGTLKQRMTAQAKIEKIIAIDSRWGNYRIFLFRTPDGAILKWKTSTDTDTTLAGRPANTGDDVRLTFTPVKHETYKDEPQTTVNRCKMEAMA